MSVLVQWFLSGQVRHALDLRKHVRNLLEAQRDLLAPEAITALEKKETAGGPAPAHGQKPAHGVASRPHPAE